MELKQLFFLHAKKFLFRKILMTSLHVVCPPQIKNPGYAYVIGADFILFSAQQEKIFAALELWYSRLPIQTNRKS